MKQVFIGSAILAALMVLPAAAPAQFLKSDAVDFRAILDAPPAKDSHQTKDEIEKMLVLQRARTPEEIKRAQAEVRITPFVYSDVFGSRFNPDDLPVTAALMKEVAAETSAVTGQAKEFYGRERPFLVDSRLVPCVRLEQSASYPSGHSTSATVWALILAEIDPAHRDALIARSRQIGDDRVLGGVHFPSDVAAGRVLGAAIAKQMLANPDFRAQLEKARQEWRGRESKLTDVDLKGAAP